MDSVAVASNSCSSRRVSETFYSKVRSLAVFSKICGAFPLGHTFKKDGRKLDHSFFSLIYVFDLIMVCIYMIWYAKMCLHLIDAPEYGTEENQITLTVWLTLTAYTVIIRGTIQFLVVHAHAGRFPALFAAFEEYHQGIGVNIIKIKEIKCACFQKIINFFLSIMWTILVLALSQCVSLFFFNQLNPELPAQVILPTSTSYMFANIWKELPMIMFTKLCIHLTKRLNEIKEELKKVRENSNTKDKAQDLERLRLQHAAVLRIISLLQRCYGLQLAVNFGFLVVEIVLPLFVFFIITRTKNAILLGFAIYYVFMGLVMLVIVEKMERTGKSLLEEIAAYEVYSKSRDQQLQIQLFTAQITSQPVRLSASGFFNINNALLCTIMGGVATYLVMMVQFAPYINEQWGNMTIMSIEVVEPPYTSM